MLLFHENEPADIQAKDSQMTEVLKAGSGHGSVQAILEGGPASIPQTSRLRLVNPSDQKVKVPHCGGYEHFERVEPSEEDAAAEIIFHWTMRTKVAE
jgi:hypothetical protein